MAQHAPHSSTHSADNRVARAQSSSTDHWAGGTGGSGDWNTGADWTGGTVPGSTDTAAFGLGGEAYTVTGDATIGAIAIDADSVTFDGAVSQDASVNGNFLSATNGAFVTLDANASFLGNGGLDFAAGTLLDVQGSLTLLNGGGMADQVIVEGLSGAFVTGSAITVNGLYVQTGGSFTGDVMLNDGGNITVDSSSLFGADSISLLGSGTIYESLASGAASSQSNVAAAVAVAAGNTLTLASDPGVNFLMSGVVSGAGAVVVNGGSVELAGVNDFHGGLSAQNATLTIDGVGASGGNPIFLNAALLVSQADSSGAVDFSGTVVATGASDTVDAVAGSLRIFAGGAGAVSVAGGAGTDTIIGGSGALSVTGGSAGDLVFGGAGGLDFIGGAGFSTVVGNAGAMTVQAGTGNTAVYGGAGALNFIGGAAASYIVGGAGVVSATGGSAGDLIFGGSSGADRLFTGVGPTTLVGGAGAQLIATGSANCALVDGGGAILDAAASTGNDTLFGARAGGTDTIVSGAGTSIVVLDGGATDVFTTGTAEVFAGAGMLNLDYIAGSGGGITKVEGFDTSKDVITLNGYAQGTGAQVLANETVSGGNTILQIPGGGDLIVLFGTTGLTAGNFA